MARIPRSVAALLAVSSVTVLGCFFPTDKSGDLRVVAGDVGVLLVKDSVLITAEVVNDQGAAVPNAQVLFTSEDPTVAFVSPDGALVAVGAGQTTITATAVGFAGAAAAQIVATVRAPLGLDSIRPTTAEYGSLLRLYGVGLDPAGLYGVELGGEEAPIYDYQPDATDARFGTLRVWAAPPSELRSNISVLGVAGGVVWQNNITVLQRDVYEPNDTSFADLGALTGGLANPALAFEPRGRTDFREATDWYRFTNATSRDRTILVGGEGIGSEIFQVFMSDSMIPYGEYFGYFIGLSAWTIGPELYACGGWFFQPYEEATPISIVALRNLPQGNYHLLSFYTPQPAPNRYGLVVANEYVSVLPPDAAEENDYCDRAPNISVGTGAAALTIDNPHDIDWFKFTVPTGGRTVTLTASAQDTLADLDFWVLTDDGFLNEVAWGLAFGQTEQLVADLPAGNYFLAVVDYPGRPTRYTMTASQAAPPAGVVATALQWENAELLRARMTKAAAAAPGRGTPRPIRTRR